jgi:hypothetical protein
LGVAFALTPVTLRFGSSPPDNLASIFDTILENQSQLSAFSARLPRQ